jgi:hypothetical protein
VRHGDFGATVIPRGACFSARRWPSAAPCAIRVAVIVRSPLRRVTAADRHGASRGRAKAQKHTPGFEPIKNPCNKLRMP